MEVLVNIRISLIRQKSGTYRRMVKVNKSIGEVQSDERYTVIEDEECFTVIDFFNNEK